MGATTEDALCVKARRSDLLLRLKSLQVMRKALVVGVAVNGSSHSLSYNGRGGLNVSSVRTLNSTTLTSDLVHLGGRYRR